MFQFVPFFSFINERVFAFSLILILTITAPAIGGYLNMYLQKKSNKSLSVQDYIYNLFVLCSCCFCLFIILLLKEFLFTNYLIIEILNSIVILNKNLELFFITLKVVVVLIPTILVYLYIKINKIWKNLRSNYYNLLCNILLKIFFYLSSSLILYLILSINSYYLLPYLALNKLILLIKNISIDNFIKDIRFGWGSSTRCYIFPENIPVTNHLVGPPTIEPNTEFKEKIKFKILNILGYPYLDRGTTHFFSQFDNHNWEFLGGLLGERDYLQNHHAIMKHHVTRKGYHAQLVEELSLVSAAKLIHFPLVDHDNNKYKFIHLWTYVDSPQFGLNLFKTTNGYTVYLKAFDTIYAPMMPRNVIYVYSDEGYRRYIPGYIGHAEKKLFLRVKFDNIHQPKDFDLNIISPKRDNFITPLSRTDSLGMYFNNISDPWKSCIIQSLKDKKEFLDQRIHTVSNKTKIWKS